MGYGLINFKQKVKCHLIYIGTHPQLTKFIMHSEISTHSKQI